MFKLLCVALLPLALASAEYLYGDGYTYNTAYASAYDNYKPRDYKFEYGVSDPHTGDHKSQWEVKENGVVRGAYSLLEADGTTRIVEYYADDTGFHADVKKIGTAVHAQQEHQIQLAPIVKNQIIDSIAYNGYGHGGLEHGYGAPIETVHHEAVPVAKEVVVEAPVQKVEQIIEPQLEQVLHQEAPLSVEKFAPIAPAQYIKEIAPQSFNPIYEQIAKYAPVPQFYEPKVESYYPAPAAKVLSYPQAYYQTPVANYEAYPVHTKIEQAYYPQSPIQQYYQAPIAKVASVAKVVVPEVHVSKVQAYAPYQEQAKVAAIPVSHSQIPYYEQAKVALPAIQVSKIQAYAPYYEQAKLEAVPVAHNQPQYYEQAKVVAQNQAQYYEQPKLQAYYLPQVAKVEKPIYYEQQQQQQQHLVKSEIPQSFILGELAKIAPHIEPKYKDAVTYAQPAYHSYHPEY